MAERFRTTLDGGIVLGRASNLTQAVNYAKTYAHKQRVYIKNTTTHHTLIIIPGEESRATNMVGDTIDHPDWAVKALRLLTF